MKYLAAYCMIAMSGAVPSEKEVKKVLESVGCEVDSESLKRVFTAMEGKTLNEVIASGMSKLSSMGGAASSSATVATKEAPKAEAKKVEVEEEEEEEDVDMGDLFGDF
jgi:large subunit ribosomal protein LP2